LTRLYPGNIVNLDENGERTVSEAVELKPIKNGSVVDMVMDRITDAIITGQYKPGDKIPTEEKLSAALGVARNSVREAVKVLVALGVLEIRRADGTFVARGYSEHMFHSALYGMIVEGSAIQDIIELRRIFEEGVTQIAIARGTLEDMELVGRRRDELIELLNSYGGDIEAIIQSDVAFHQSIEAAAHNALLPNVSRVITRLTIPSRRETTRHAIESGNLDFLIRSHQMLADIVINRKGDKVLEAIQYHYNMWSGAFT